MGSNVGTRGDVVYQNIRADILGGVLPPGAKLRFAWLSERYGASTGVLREALPRLVEQGLVISEAQVGFHVVPVSVADLRHLTEARVAIETLTLAQSIRHGDIAWESRLLAAHHTLARTPLEGVDGQAISEDWRVAHSDFHSILLAAAPNARLRGIATSLRDAGELYRCWSHGLPKDYGFEQDRDIASEHARILDAALARDVDRAVDELTRHIELTRDILIRMSQEERPAVANTVCHTPDGNGG